MSETREHHWGKKKAAREAKLADRAKEYRNIASRYDDMAEEPGLMGQIARIQASTYRFWAKAYDTP